MRLNILMWGLLFLLVSPFVIANREITNNSRGVPISLRDKIVEINCDDVLIANTVLTSDLNCTGDGIIINNSNVNLDCDGHTITYGNSGKNDVYGIYLMGIQSISGHDNVTIENCEIVEGNELGNEKHGIYLEGEPANPFPGLYSENIIVKNNQVKTISSGSHALRTWGIGPESIIQNNYLESLGDEGKGISMMCTMQTVFLKNTIKTSLIDGIGIYVGDWGNNQNEIKENIIVESDMGIQVFLNEYVPTYQFWNDKILYEGNEIYNSRIGLFFSEDGHPLGPDSIIRNNIFVEINEEEVLMEENVDNQIFENQNFGKYKIINSLLTIKKTGLGEVWFDERMTVSGDNLDEDVSIADNSIRVDINNKPAFNVSGHIVLDEPTTQFFAPYYVMKDNSRCTAPYGDVCTNYENEGEEFSFDVSEMALEFSIEGSSDLVPDKKKNKNEINVIKELEKRINETFEKETKDIKIGRSNKKTNNQVKKVVSIGSQIEAAKQDKKGFISFYI